jgi:predicted DNA-binding transcriptional regulator YafY
MNRTDRLLAIILELQRAGRQRAEDLASTFETSKRTIYRDIQALCEAGVPLISVPGRGYSLMEGYFLPPLSFTTAEATMLMLGSDYMAHNFDAQYRAAALSAQRKIESVLPEQLRTEVAYLQSNIQFVSRDTTHTSAQHMLLQQLRRALIECITVRFRYYTRHGTQDPLAVSTREADPYSLAFVSGNWYVVAHCHLRKSIRNFRLDRMEELLLLPQTFQRSTNLPLQIQEQRQHKVGTVLVRALFDHEITRWVRENRSFYTVTEEETASGLLVTLRIQHESEILHWLLSWGAHVHVLEPETLRQCVLAEAQALVKNHQSC